MKHEASKPTPETSFIDERDVLKHRRVLRALKRSSIVGDWSDLFGQPAPDALQMPYFLNAEGKKRNSAIMAKYADRALNTRRAWNRMQRYMPELVRPNADKQVVFEMSTAHGAMLEVARHFGHEVIGNDFANMVFAKKGQEVATTRSLNDKEFTREVDDWGFEISDDPAKQDWPYRHITEAQKIPMMIFDGGITPYPIKDKSVDVTMCLQSIEHYCHPDDWMTVIEEMCRITRRSIFILLNPMHKRFKDVKGYKESFDKARIGLRDYNANGFENVATHMHWGKAHGFKLVAR
jgi:hypothetical protein